MGLGLNVASVKLRVKKDKKIEALEKSLPGINCGACGYAGCSSYAEAIASGADSDIEKCKPGGASTLTSLGKIMGIETSGGGTKMIAQVHCKGGNDVASNKFEYDGLKDCRAAYSLFSGPKSCSYGCLGLGSCVKVCPVDAIIINDKNLAWINKEICISCGKCLEVCPTGVIKMIPYDADYMVACNSKDKAKITKNNCSVGCIGCRICEKKFPDAGFTVSENLTILDYTKVDRSAQRDEAAQKCPPKCIIKA